VKPAVDEPARRSIPPRPGSPGGGLSKALSFSIAPAVLWSALRDPALIAGCIPGARLLSQEGGALAGEMTVSLGPVKARFKGQATIRYDDVAQTGAIEGSGQDQLSGTRLTARAPFRVEPGGDGAILQIDVAFSLQGPLAQLAKGRVVDLVADEIAGLFARNLTARLAGETVAPRSTLPGFAFAWRLLLAWFRGRRG
jgi:carbon-monoxide dehydrogenase small subunit